MNKQERDLVLSVRSANVAKSVGATTVAQLAQFTEMELLETRCFGETSLKEIKQKLAELGLWLGMSLSELEGRPGTQARIVGLAKPTNQEPDEEHEGPCCGRCEEAARKLRKGKERAAGAF